MRRNDGNKTRREALGGARLFEPCPNATIECGAIDCGGRSAQSSPSEPDETSLSSCAVLL
jgi:hypothetical protein